MTKVPLPYFLCPSVANKETVMRVLYGAGLNWSGYDDADGAIRAVQRWEGRLEYTHVRFDPKDRLLFARPDMVASAIERNACTMVNSLAHFVTYMRASKLMIDKVNERARPV